jgi:hypothetical protein
MGKGGDETGPVRPSASSGPSAMDGLLPLIILVRTRASARAQRAITGAAYAKPEECIT